VHSSGEKPFPGASRSLAHPFLAGTPPQRPDAGGGRNSFSGSLRRRRSGAPLRSRGILVAAKRRRLGSGALCRLGRNIARGPATFRPDRALRRLRDTTPAARTSAFLADSVSPLPDCRVGFTPHLHAARFTRVNSIGRARAAPEPGFRDAQTPLGLRSLALVAPLAHPYLVSKATPRGLPDYSTCAGWRSSARAPPPVRASGIARYAALHLARPVLGSGIPPGRPIFRFRLG